MCARVRQGDLAFNWLEPWGEPLYPGDLPKTALFPGMDLELLRLGPLGAPQRVRLRWGLVPAWAREASIGRHAYNARAESVAEKPSFREAFGKRRCLVPVDCFFEWAAAEGGTKRLLRIWRRETGPLVFAGLWERNEALGLETCTIVTTTPSEGLARVHDRMPVALEPDAQRAWMAPESTSKALLALCRPWGGADGLAWEAEPASPRRDAPGGQGSLF